MPLQADHRAPSRFAGLPLLAAALAFSGCHRPPSPDVVATVNGKQIVRVDLERYYKASLGDNPQQPSPEQADIGRLTILHEMIEDEILQQRAAKLNLAASDEDVNAKLTEIKAPFTQEEFDNKLKQREMTLDDLKRDLRKQLTKTKLLNKEIESRINITDAEIAGYFAAHKAEFNLIEPQYRLAQIVVTAGPAQANGNPQDSRPVSDADARKKIESLRTRLDNGEDFGAVAMNSDDPNTAQNGGDMGFVQESALRRDPPVYDAIGKLKPGAITDILPIVDGASHRIMGYAIYKLISREPAGQRELNDPRVQQTIRQGLRDGHAQLLKNAYFEKLHDEAKVHNYLADQILKLGAQ